MRSTCVPLVCAVVALVLSAAGCGEDREGSVEPSGGGTDTAGTTSTDGSSTTGTSTSPQATGGKPVATVKVNETEYSLFPDNPKVDKAGLVKFEVKNAGTLTHALEVEGPGGEVETKGIKPGESATLEADLSKPGTYKWYCPIDDHESRGMKGEITVAGGRSGKTTDAREGDDSDRDDGSGKDDSGKDKDDSRKRGGASGKREGSEPRGGAGGGVY